MPMSASRLTTCALLACLPALFAADLSLSDQFYDAIRRDDSAAVQKLLAAGAAVNVKDSRGGTPLMYAASVGTEAMMRRLIDAGAGVNARNAFDAAPLLFCADNLSRVKLLLDHGADVNVRSKLGHTPLAVAARRAGNIETVKLLLAKGAKLDAPPAETGDTVLGNAAYANDTAIVKLLLATNEKAALAGPGGPQALINAGMYGNVELLKLLLGKGVPPNVQSPPEFTRVKNGPIAIGSLSPLLLASTSGNVEAVRVLLDAGADVNLRDVRGMTPLMFAVATDHPNHDIIRLLLAHHADTAAKSKAGETALDWALKFQQPAVVAAIREASPGVKPVSRPQFPAPRGASDVRTALQRSTALLQASGTTTFREGGCISCHGGNIVSTVTATARRAGVKIDEAAAAETMKATRLQFAARADGLLEREDGAAVEILTFALAALADSDAAPDRVTDAMVVNLAAQQLTTGHWPFGGIMRPPTADSPFTNTAFAIRGLRKYAPPARRAEFDDRIALAARALSSAEPATTEDAVTQLLGLTWAGAGRARIDALAQRLAAKQREDGGWTQTQYLASDAWATSTVLNALHEAGLRADAPAYRKGVAFLLKTQADDGSWHVASRAPKFQPYFEGGFPYAHDQWISQWATGWATVALSHAVPTP